ncbi:hypothetical protein [Kitasatospora sp. NPDC101183]|uniref:hypothetical protein n=1 Tax=Kitasatospora sp. NPDC101183 TaxID=3364100 RepID=UPI0037F4D4F7
MPDFGGGLAKMAVTSAVVATAAFGLATPSHAARQDAPASAAHGAHAPVRGAASVQAVTEDQEDQENQGHYLSNPL